MPKILTALLLASLVLTVGCGSKGKKKLAYVERPAEKIYLEGYDRMGRNDWPRAILLFDEVERQHPYSVWARRSMLMAAYANYKANKYDDAINAAQRFVALHPGSRSAPYAYYLIGICHFEQISDVGRDQSETKQALSALRQVVRRFPNSQYARDARLKIDLTNDQLAGKDMAVGRWYLKRGYNLAAIARFQHVVEVYQTTSHTPEALHRLVEAYVRLGILDEAVQVAAVLGYNYPGTDWYQDTYLLLSKNGVTNVAEAQEEQSSEQKKKGSFISRTWRRLF
ncbi:MAG: outer membrane protein assembly factor BamD [Robiginitomaculum sp.]|nr:MAG: outer membrane protein assembly factor BamD [Robiginitomaculum sp.]